MVAVAVAEVAAEVGVGEEVAEVEVGVECALRAVSSRRTRGTDSAAERAVRQAQAQAQAQAQLLPHQ
jgi:hypothetical protein